MDTSKKVITIAYCGPAVDNGTMDIRDLAPALLAFSDFITGANKVLNNDSSQISVRVNADFRQGSFEIHLAVIKTLAQQMQDLWNASGVDAGEILALLGLCVAADKEGLIDLIKEIGGRVVKAIVESKEQPGKSIFYIKGDHNVILADSKVAKLYKDTSTMKNIGKVLSPLQQDGIDAFEIREKRASPQAAKRITKEDSRYFETVEDSPLTYVTAQSVWVKVLSVSFEDLKWKLQTGEQKIFAAMNDADFQKRMDKHQVWFGKDDKLKVLLETTQELNKRGDIINQYAILKVEDVFHQKEETELPFDE